MGIQRREALLSAFERGCYADEWLHAYWSGSRDTGFGHLANVQNAIQFIVRQ